MRTNETTREGREEGPVSKLLPQAAELNAKTEEQAEAEDEKHYHVYSQQQLCPTCWGRRRFEEKKQKQKKNNKKREEEKASAWNYPAER
ncbi:hypothetical protein AOLI_G00268300 [Acnodon oligacanthus]